MGSMSIYWFIEHESVDLLACFAASPHFRVVFAGILNTGCWQHVEQILELAIKLIDTSNYHCMGVDIWNVQGFAKFAACLAQQTPPKVVKRC